LPLVIVGSRVDARESVPGDRGVARFDVRNDGTKTVLAFGIGFELTVPGGKTDSHGFSTDSAHTVASLRTSEIAPRGQATLPSGGGELVSLEATPGAARVTFIIFDDDTAVGDDKEIAWIFAERRKHQAFWHKMNVMLSEATARETDPSAVFALLRTRMESDPDPTFKTGDGGWYGEILARMTERRMELTHTTPQYILETLRATIAEHKALCDQHLERRR
jgi:hypothetical protein